jgi:hypothetical protein
MSLSEISNLLWRERQLLELLLFKLEEEQLVLASGRTRWLAAATREVETVLDEIRRVELARSAEVEVVAAELGLGPGPSLRELASVAPAPWGGIFEEHRRAFLSTTDEITTLAQANRDLLTRGYTAAQEFLRSLGETRVDTYSSTGAPSATRLGARLIDEAL